MKNLSTNPWPVTGSLAATILKSAKICGSAGPLYDALNRLTNLVDAVGTNVYSYDAAGQLLSDDGLWPNDTVSYTYANRLRTSLGIASPTGSEWSQTYGYDDTRRLTSTTSPAGTFGYVYDPVQMQRVDTLTLPSGAAITNGYDSEARLTIKGSVNDIVISRWRARLALHLVRNRSIIRLASGSDRVRGKVAKI